MRVAWLVGEFTTKTKAFALQLVVTLLQIVESLVRDAATLIVDIGLFEIVDAAAIHVVRDAAHRGKRGASIAKAEVCTRRELEVTDLGIAQWFIAGTDPTGEKWCVVGA